MFKQLIIIICVSVFVVALKSHESEENPGVDALIQSLKQEEWKDDEAPCLEKTLHLLNNVKNFTLWATWAWDANKLPSGSLYGSWNQLSNFAQCMNPPWLHTHPQLRNQYCLAEVQMTHKELKKKVFDPYGSTEVFLRTKSRFGLPVNRFTWGICVPASCQPPSIVKIVRSMFLGTHFRAISKPNITVDGCQLAGTKEEYSTGYYLFMFLIATLLLISVTSTIYSSIRSHATPSNSIGAVLLKSFCMKKNSSELTKLNKDEINVLNGIRFMTAASVVLLHVIYLTVMSGTVNSGDLDNRNHYFDKLLTMNIVVDTFFAMSGLLHIKGLLAKKQNLFIALWKRYVRLVGLVAIAVFYYMSVIKFLGSGPFWKKMFEYESLICQKYFLPSLLMINTSKDTLCYPVTWYTACDYQLAVFATSLFYIYQRKKSFAFKIFGSSAVMSLVIPGVLTYWHNLPSIFVLDFENLIYKRGYEPFDYTYFKSYSRAGPYLVGVGMGYLMHIYKPTHYRRSLSTVFSIIGTIISLVLMWLVFNLGSFLIEREYDALEAAVIATFYRTIWGIAVCCIVGMCEYGYVPFVTEFLSLPFFIPLSRLSYGLFMVHFAVLLHTNRMVTIQSPPVYDMFAFVIDTAGIIMVSLGISYILWLIVEAPLKNLSDHFICNRWKVTEGDQNVPENELKCKAT